MQNRREFMIGAGAGVVAATVVAPALASAVIETPAITVAPGVMKGVRHTYFIDNGALKWEHDIVNPDWHGVYIRTIQHLRPNQMPEIKYIVMSPKEWDDADRGLIYEGQKLATKAAMKIEEDRTGDDWCAIHYVNFVSKA